MSATKIKKLKQLKALSKLLDNAIKIPGTKYSIGLDPIIGLFPAVGDYLTMIISGYIVFEAAKLGAKQDTLTKMAMNIFIDSLVGTVPIAGDLFDVAWKANQMNLELLEQALPTPEQENSLLTPTPEKIDWKPIILIFGAIAIIVTISSIIFLWLLKLIIAFLFS